MNYNYNTGIYPDYNQQMQFQKMQQLQQLQQMNNNLQSNQQQHNQQQINQQYIINVNDVETIQNYNIPFDGSINYFRCGNDIYTKQLENNGIISLKKYSLSENINNNKFVTREEFDNVKNILDNLLNNLGGNENAK